MTVLVNTIQVNKMQVNEFQAMRVYGAYDTDNDWVCDIWVMILAEIMTIPLREHEVIFNIVEEWVRRREALVASAPDDTDFSGNREGGVRGACEQVGNGIFLFACMYVNGYDPNMVSLKASTLGSPLDKFALSDPRIIDKDLVDELIRGVDTLLKDLDGWEDPEARKAALMDERRFFTVILDGR